MYTINQYDLRAIKQFLDQYRGLTQAQLAQLAGRSLRTIRLWKIRCGYIKPKVAKYVYAHKIKRVNIDKKIWDSEQWLRWAYEDQRLGTSAIAWMVGVHPKCIYQKLNKFKIKPRNMKEACDSRHPCCNRKWVEEHYLIMGLSIPECAKVARVSIYTFYTWLVKCHIPIRDKREALLGERGYSHHKHQIARQLGRRVQWKPRTRPSKLLESII